MYKTASLYAS